MPTVAYAVQESHSALPPIFSAYPPRIERWFPSLFSCTCLSVTDDGGVSVISTCVAVSGAEDVCRTVPNDGALARILRGTTGAVVVLLEAVVRCANGFAEATAGTAAAAATAATTRPLMVAACG